MVRPLPPPAGPAGPDPSPGGAGGSGGSIAHFGLSGLFFNPSLFAALLSCLIAQLAKPLVHFHTHKQLDWLLVLSPGKMPSSHTASVVGLATAVGIKEGTSSTMFALALLLSLVVAYDATGVRLHAGRHASVLNLIVAQLPSEHPAAETMLLQETLGHTPLQVVCGAGVGLVVGALVAGLGSL